MGELVRLLRFDRTYQRLVNELGTDSVFNALGADTQSISKEIRLKMAKISDLIRKHGTDPVTIALLRVPVEQADCLIRSEGIDSLS